MFTGIIESLGSIESREVHGNDAQLLIAAGNMELSDVKPGDSMAVNGVCLTVTEISNSRFLVDVSAETLAHTTLAELKTGSAVNLEKALTPSSRLGGHIVSGHVDGVGKVVDRKTIGQSEQLRIHIPKNLIRYVARKGSICIDGISLTINEIINSDIVLNIIPHTLQHTTIASLNKGASVNIEVDVIARYLERLLLGNDEAAESGITLELLRRHGFTE